MKILSERSLALGDLFKTGWFIFFRRCWRGSCDVRLLFGSGSVHFVDSVLDLLLASKSTVTQQINKCVRSKRKARFKAAIAY